MKKFIFILLGLILILPSSSSAQQNLAQRMQGRILLQVEQHGEAWYVHPGTRKRHYLGRPKDAFQVMREQGQGISTADLEKIPIGLADTTSTDTDGDGLADDLETAIGTDPNTADTDGDGYQDKLELRNGYSPKAALKRLAYDTSFATEHLGKIFLQVESHGEAWYLNPVDGKRYFLGRPADAFGIMRSLGEGISNQDIDGIEKVPTFTFQPSGDISFREFNTSRDHIRGNINEARVVVVTYEDLECPFCKRFHSTLNTLMTEYPTQLAWVFRHFPLESIHPNARDLAIGLECAAQVGGENAFWEMLDALYSEQGTTDGIDELMQIAEKNNLNIISMMQCFESTEPDQKVSEDYADAIEAQGRGTPYSVLVNQKGKTTVVSGAIPIEQLRSYIDALLD